MADSLYLTPILQSYLRHTVSDNADVWSDFVGGGSAASDYTNSGTPPVSLTNLKVDHEFMNGASYSESCVIMKGSQNYTLNGEACTTTAKFMCMKTCKYAI